MKKILLMLICLLTLLVFASLSFASSDADNIANDESIQIYDNPNGGSVIPINMTIPDYTSSEEAVNVESVNQTIKNDAFAGNESSKNTPELNITGPKINSTDLNIKGPKITGNGPKLTISQKQKDIYHYANLFLKHPDLAISNMAIRVLDECAYTWEDTADIIAQAHNIALHHYNGSDMKVNHELTKQEVWDYMSQDMYLIMKHSGRS